MSKKSDTKDLKKMKEGEDVLLSEETTVYLIDCSGSMNDMMAGSSSYSDYSGGDLNPDGEEVNLINCRKVTAVKRAMVAMLEARQSYPTADKIGIVGFSGSYNEQKFSRSLIDPEMVSSDHFKAVASLWATGGTPMYQGFEKAARLLADAEGMARIVLISDGEPNEGYEKDDIRKLVGTFNTDYGFVIDCVGIGIPGKTSAYDEAFMKDLAKLGSGEFYPVEDLDELTKRLVRMVQERYLLIGEGIKLLAAKA